MQGYLRHLLILFLTLLTMISLPASAGLTDGLVGWYKLDGSVADSSANALHGSAQGAGSYVTGMSGNGYQFVGDYGSYIQIPNSASIPLISNELSLSYWIKKKLNDSGGTGPNRWHWYAKAWHSGISDDNKVSFAIADAGFVPNGAPGHAVNASGKLVLPDNQWALVTQVFSNGVYKGYIDGVLIAQETLSINAINGNPGLPILIAKQGDTCCGDHLKAAMDDIRIYNRALSDAEIQQLYGQLSATVPTLASITLDANTLAVGETTTIRANPSSASLGTCTSSNASVATVNDATITAGSTGGTTTIICNGVSAMLTVTAPIPINGNCGASNGTSLSTKPTTSLCSTGTAGTISGSGPWSWSCNGSNGGAAASCSANLLVVTNGSCGASNGMSLSAKPTTNLCSTGAAGTISGSGPWSWSCAGSNGGAVASCSASLLPASYILTGTVVDKVGRPIPNATVATVRAGVNYTATTDASGNFRLAIEKNNLPSTIAYWVTQPGYGNYSANLNVSGDGSNVGQIVLEAVVSSSGVVEIAADLYHLGDDRFSGGYNSQFQKSSDGLEFIRTFLLTTEHLTNTQASLSLLAKGMEGRNPVSINGRVAGYLSSSPSDGRFATTSLSIPISSFVVGENTLGIRSVEINSFDDFEFTNVAIRFSGASTQTPVNAACGSADGTSASSRPTSNLCSTGTATTVSGSGPWSWSCTGSNGGATASCTAIILTVTNGNCGASNGMSMTTIPTVNLCTTGTAGTVSGSGPWSWSCTGSNGGTTMSCTASQRPTTITKTLTVSKSGSGMVSSSAAGIACGSDCSEAYNIGTDITLTATPASGYSFAGWSGACSGQSACVVSMNADQSVTASFTVTTDGTSATSINNGLVGYWSFDNCDATDTSGNGNNGTIHGDPVCIDRDGKKAFRFNGYSDYIVVPNSSSFPSSAITISYWVNREGNQISGRWENYLSKEWAFQSYAETGSANCTNCFSAGFYQGTPGYWSGYYSESNSLSFSDWVLYSFTFDNATRVGNVYINGILVNSFTEVDQNSRLRTSKQPLYIGRNGSAAVYYIQGVLDDLRIYDRVLSVAEIQQLAANQIVPPAQTDIDHVFNWAESAYPELFAPADASTKSLFGYTYRFYSVTNSYLGTKDGRLFYIGPLGDNQLLDVGALDDYIAQATEAGF